MSQTRQLIEAFFERARTAEIVTADTEPVKERMDSDTEDKECIYVCCDDLENQESGRQTQHEDEDPKITETFSENLQQMEVEDGGYHYLLLLQMRIPGSTTLHVRTTVTALKCVHDDEMDGS